MSSRLFSKEPDLPAKTARAEIAPPPRMCDEPGCATPTAILFLVVEDSAGNRKCGSCSDFGRRTKEGGISMDAGYKFVSWVSRCWSHYERDTYARRRGQWDGITDKAIPFAEGLE